MLPSPWYPDTSSFMKAAKLNVDEIYIFNSPLSTPIHRKWFGKPLGETNTRTIWHGEMTGVAVLFCLFLMLFLSAFIVQPSLVQYLLLGRHQNTRWITYFRALMIVADNVCKSPFHWLFKAVKKYWIQLYIIMLLLKLNQPVKFLFLENGQN